MADYTVAELMAAIKREHPELGNISDKDLLHAVSQEHPDLVKGAREFQQPPEAPKKSFMSQVGEFLGSFAENANPIPPLYDAIQHPVDTAKGMLNAQGEQYTKAKQALSEGRYSEAVGHGLAYALPVVGPAAANAGEEIGSGQYAKGFGHTAGLIVPFAHEPVIKAAGAVDRGVTNALSPEVLRNLSIKLRELRDTKSPLMRPTAGAAGAMVGAAIGHQLAPGMIAPTAGASGGLVIGEHVARVGADLASRGVNKVAQIRESMGAPRYNVEPSVREQARVEAAAGMTEEQYQAARAASDAAVDQDFHATPFWANGTPAGSFGDRIVLDKLMEENRLGKLQKIRGEAPAPLGPLDKPIPGVSPEVAMAREALMEDGAPRTPANLELAGQNAKYLLDMFPEMKGLKPGNQFNVRLYNILDNTGTELAAAERSIPRDTVVPSRPYIPELDAVIERAARFGDSAPVRAALKLKTLFETGDVTWENFIRDKRAFFEEVPLTSETGKAVYDILKSISDDVSPKLTELNQKWFTAKISADLAKVSPYSGEKLKQVAKDQVANQKARAKK